MHKRRSLRSRCYDALCTVLLWGVALCAIITLLWIIGDVAWRGARHALDASYWLGLPQSGGREGGILPLFVSTALVLGIGLVVSVPVGFFAALWLWQAKPSLCVSAVRQALSVLAALPSLVIGLFGLALFHELLGLKVSILLGGLTCAVMVLPIFTIGVEGGLRQVPEALTKGAAALGVSLHTSLWRIVLPAAAPTIGACLALTAGRILGESAALLLTAGPSLRMPESVLDQGRVLAYHIYLLAAELPGGEPRAYSAAFALLIFIIIVDVSAAYLSEKALKRSLP